MSTTRYGVRNAGGEVLGEHLTLDQVEQLRREIRSDVEAEEAEERAYADADDDTPVPALDLDTDEGIGIIVEEEFADED